MIRFEGSIAAVEAVESIIKTETIYYGIKFSPFLMHDGSNGVNLQGENIQSSRYARTYDVCADRAKVHKLTGVDEQVRNFLLWVVLEPIRVNINYDKRANTGGIIISRGSWRRLGILKPALKGILEEHGGQLGGVVYAGA